MKRTKIVCTIGPASDSRSKIETMLKSGMNVARLNFSHGTYKDHSKLLKIIRAASIKTGLPVAILQDLQGPKIRTGDLPKEGIMIKKGETITLTTNLKHTGKKIPVTYKNFCKDVKKGDHVLIDDGLMEIVIIGIRGDDVSAKVINGGVLLSHKGLNLPDTKVSISAITIKDREDLEFGIRNNVDYVALSFVRHQDDVKELRRMITRFEKKYKITEPTRIIVKIEKKEAIEHFDDILAETDAVMIARGDLGVETPASQVPVVQKTLIQKCRDAGKPVVVATQMLDSMIRNPRPTRAEVSDVANAVADHADAVMLSGESAYGKYPVESVKVMAKTIEEMEVSAFDDAPLLEECEEILKMNVAISTSAVILAKAVDARVILISSESGYTARMVSRLRPEFSLCVATHSKKVMRQMNLIWGVQPFVVADSGKLDDIFKRSISLLGKRGVVRQNDKIVIVSTQRAEMKNAQNWVKILRID